MPKMIDLRGKRFGRLVVSDIGTYTGKDPRWVCRCDCGRIVTVSGAKLRSGNTRSCTCLRAELTGERGRTINATHGRSRTPEYRIWASMLARCHGALSQRKNYGGRGISVCKEWRDDFAAFFRDMGARPSRHHSIDRIDNSGNYTPENCRWATTTTQHNNTRANRVLTLDGASRTAAEWSRLLGISQNAIYTRKRQGWDDRRILLTPIQKRRKRA
jgi:hypothetical protein